jgi:hypothetical protein
MEGVEAGATKEGVTVMKRTFALLTTVAVGVGSLAVAPAANAAMRYFGQERYYAVPFVSRFRESPTYAPDRRAPRNYNNAGRPDFQDGSRG